MTKMVGQTTKEVEQRKPIKKGSIGKTILVCVLTIIAVVLIGFVVKYFQGG